MIQFKKNEDLAVVPKPLPLGSTSYKVTSPKPLAVPGTGEIRVEKKPSRKIRRKTQQRKRSNDRKIVRTEYQVQQTKAHETAVTLSSTGASGVPILGGQPKSLSPSNPDNRD